MKNMNLAHMKKISDDGKSAVFKHRDGHEIRIAKSALSPAMREELKKLPVHAAEGDDVIPSDYGQNSTPVGQDYTTESKPYSRWDTFVNSLPSSPNIDTSNKPYNAAGAAQEMSGLGPASAPPPQEAPDESLLATNQAPVPPRSEAPASEPAAPAPQQTPDQTRTPAAMQAAPNMGAPTMDKQNPAPVSVGQDLANEDQLMAHDLAMGQIKPETYQDLFNNKDTLGKVGTIFGLMIGGAGAGLSHQPNQLLQMMNQEIERDLQAKTTSTKNALDLYKMHQEKQLQNAQIGRIGAENQATRQDIAMKQQEMSIQHQSFEWMAKNRIAFQHQADIVKNMAPNDPQRPAAEQALALMGQAVDAKNADIASLAEAKSAQLKQMGIDMGGSPQGGASQDTDQTAVRLRKMQALGYINPEQYKDSNKELAMIKNKNQANKNALDSFDKVATLQTLGTRVTNPLQYQERIDSQWNPMIEKITKDNEGRVTPITVDMMASLKPKLTDNKETLKIKRNKFNAILTAGYATPTLDGLQLTPQKTGMGSDQSGGQAAETKTMGGIQYQKVPGGWQRVK